MVNRTFYGPLSTLLAGAALIPFSAHADTNAELLQQLQALKAEVSRLETRVTVAEQQAHNVQVHGADTHETTTPTQIVRSGQSVSVDAGAPQEPATAADANPSSAAPDYQYRVVNSNGNALVFSGDVELNINANSDATTGNLVFSNDDHGYQHDRHHSGQDGRIMFEAAGTRTHGDKFASFRIQPLLHTSGNVGLDDAWFAFGQRNGWGARVGRYEAYDLFPVGADTFLGYSGDTANNLYKDGAGYSYQAKEGRGRAGSAGQMMVSRQFGNVYFETSSVVGDRTDLFDIGYSGKNNDKNKGKTYHGVDIDTGRSKSTVLLRPVLAWQFAPKWRVAGGVEKNLVHNATIDKRGNDVSDRTGYATTLGYSDQDLQLNFNVAYLDALDENDLSVGANMVYNGLGLGYIHSYNDIDWSEDDPDGSKYHIDTLYTSYQFSNVFDIDRFNMLVGTYYSRFSAQTHDDAYGVRLRFKYFL